MAKSKKKPTARQVDPAGLALLARSFSAELARRLRSARAEILALLADPALLELRAELALVGNSLKPFQDEPGLLSAFREKVGEILHRYLTGKVPGGLGRPPRYWWQVFTAKALAKGISDATSSLSGAIVATFGSLGQALGTGGTRAALAVERQLGVILGFAGRLTGEVASALNTAATTGVGRLAAVGKAIAAAVAKYAGAGARRLARGELQAEYAAGQLEAFRDAGIQEVVLQAEVATAGDDKVCRYCQAQAGKRYTLAEAEGLIPFHIGCRCIWLAVLASGPFSG